MPTKNDGTENRGGSPKVRWDRGHDTTGASAAPKDVSGTANLESDTKVYGPSTREAPTGKQSHLPSAVDSHKDATV